MKSTAVPRLTVFFCALVFSVVLAGGAAADPPAVSLISPADGSVTRDATPSFEGIGGTAEGDTDVTVKLWTGSQTTGAPVRVLPPAAVDPDTGAWSATPTGALPAGTYSAQAEQADTAGNSGTSSVSFVIDTSPPVFNVVGASQVIEQTSPAGAVATYGVSVADALDPAPSAWCSPSSGAVFPPGVTTVSCSATDWAGNSAGTQLTVTVANAMQPAAVVALLARAANGRVRLSWKKPTDWDYDQVIIRRAPRGSSEWSVLYEGSSATAFIDRRVRNDREYVYAAQSYDSAGNVSSSVTSRARPSAFLSPGWNAVWNSPRVLRWAVVRKAAYYNIQVWRDGRKILSRWPGRPRFRLQKTWTHDGRRYSLADGTYVVYAWPGLGPKAAARYGRLVGWTKFRID